MKNNFFITALSLLLLIGISSCKKKEPQHPKQGYVCELTLNATYPFSFVYDGKRSGEIINTWKKETTLEDLDADRKLKTVSFTDPETGLQVRFERIVFQDYKAVDWVIWFENTSDKPTPIIENVQALDFNMDDPEEMGGYGFTAMRGAPSNMHDFEIRSGRLSPGDSIRLDTYGGRSSNNYAPFFKLTAGSGASFYAIGWSGQWVSDLVCYENRLNVRAGMEKTHFRLEPGEKVRTPSIVIFYDSEHTGYTANGNYRQFLLKHYVPAHKGDKLPHLYCNTCFTRGGHWLNETTEENQISLIEAMKDFGITALITDAGWFEGGWPYGAGNWTPRKDNYPNGFAPVAQAAQEHDMVYGLWFEFERVMAGTDLATDHPEWVLWRKTSPKRGTGLLDMGRPEVHQHLLGIVDQYMQLPGFDAYRQDFNMDPVFHWRDNDSKDRQGITEMKYIEGIYTYYDSLVARYPNSFRVNCASGGRRIDIEMMKRFHVHQKSDYWFRETVDQASLQAISEFLPTGIIMVPINKLDNYSFYSHLPASLNLGWIADAEGFDKDKALELTQWYHQAKEYLNGHFYPLMPNQKDYSSWMGSQYHLPSQDKGLFLLCKRGGCYDEEFFIKAMWIDPDAQYELTWQSTGESTKLSGKELLSGYSVTLKEQPQGELIFYTKVK